MSSISSALKFVQGAVSKKDSNVEMKHFAIENGHIRATNGVITLGSPIDVDLNCAPMAAPLRQAIGKCKDVTSLKITPTGRLSVVSGKFRALISCVDLKDIPHPKPTGMRIDIDGPAMLDAFEKLKTFVGKDELRPWTNGVLLRGQSAFATNNACLVEYWLGTDFPDLNIPIMAINELLRIGTAPTACLSDGNSVTFLYDDNRWIKTVLYETDWPPLERILDVESEQAPLPEDLFEAVAAVRTIGENNTVNFTEEGVVANSFATGNEAAYEVEGLYPDGAYNAQMLSLLEPIAKTADFSRYPDPVIFYGDRVRGALMGVTK